MKKIVIFFIHAAALFAMLEFAYAGETRNYLVYAGPGADIQSYISGLEGFDHTNTVAGPGGSMCWLRGDGTPPVADGISVLGTSYAGVWSDTAPRAIYNSVFPPDEDGNPRPFGAFLGCEKEMGLP